MRKDLTMINFLLAAQFLVDTVICFIYVHHLFELGRIQLTKEAIDDKPDENEIRSSKSKLLKRDYLKLRRL